jgi:hypothetical protein
MESRWQEIKSQNDIDILLNNYGYFHDSCIKELTYASGVIVDKTRTMHLTGSDGAVLRITFQRQWEPIEIKLRFTGLRRMNLIGYQENYSPEILDCYLAFNNKLIVWADKEYFDINNPEVGGMLKEPMTTFVVAEKLEWRFTEE